MVSFEEEDGRVSTQRAVRRVREMWAMPTPASQHEVTTPPSTGRAPRREYDDDGDEEEKEQEDVITTPQPTRGRTSSTNRQRRAPASVSFSEPVETPPPYQEQIREEEAEEARNDHPTRHERVPLRRRNRLETRLEELQRDVANLSLRLRATSATSSQYSLSTRDDIAEGVSIHSTEDSRAALHQKLSLRHQHMPLLNTEDPLEENGPPRHRAAKSPARTILKKATTTPELKRRVTANKSPLKTTRHFQNDENAKEMQEDVQDEQETGTRRSHLAPSVAPRRSDREMLRAVRELRVVAVDRDQLRYELEQTKKALVAMEKKYHDAVKWKEAYDKMKSHCDSLQESLELSEKIRVRQKRLLQQLQQSIKDAESVVEKPPIASRSRASRTIPSHETVDVLDSILHEPTTVRTTRHESHRGVVGTAARTTTTASRRPTSSPRAVAKPIDVNTSRRSYSRSDFDSMLRLPLPDRSMVDSTALGTRQAVHRKVASTVRAKPTTTRMDTTQPHRSTTTASRRLTKPPPVPPPMPSSRSNHFLAPTQASLSHMTKRKPDATRRPFVV